MGRLWAFAALSALLLVLPVRAAVEDIPVTPRAEPEVTLDPALQSDYVVRLQNALSDAKSALATATSFDAAPSDAAAVPDAVIARSKIIAICELINDPRIWAQCLIKAQRDYFTAIKYRDTALYDAFAAVLNQAADDCAAGKFAMAELVSLQAALGNEYNRQMQALEAADTERIARTLGTQYARNFDNAYFKARALRHIESNDPPFDQSVVAKARAQREAANADCLVRLNPRAITASAWTQCYVDSDIAYLHAIKMNDEDLQKAFASTLRSAAADSDAGKFPVWQMKGVYMAMSNAYNAIEDLDYSAWNNRKNGLLFDEYKKRYADAYRASSNGKPFVGAPMQSSAPEIAKDERQKAEAACADARKKSPRTFTALAACYVQAQWDGAVNSYLKIADPALLYALQSALTEAAAEADAGKLTPDQFEAARGGILKGYADQFNAEAVNFMNANPDSKLKFSTY